MHWCDMFALLKAYSSTHLLRGSTCGQELANLRRQEAEERNRANDE
jgi:hypothetical protein